MQTRNISAFVIAAPKSNSGKTVVTLGLLQALKNRGLTVQPFKSGPDYIDPQHHTAISGRQSYNLDCWMASEAHVSGLFHQHSYNVDVAILEGAMGLFDGARRDEGSVASLARLLDLPVVLVVDAASTAYSIAPLLYGFKHFDKRIQLAGVIFNKVGSASHYQFLKQAAEDVAVDSLGYLLRDQRLEIGSRHLGLLMPQDIVGEHPVAVAAEQLEQTVDLDKLLKNTQANVSLQPKQGTKKQDFRIAFARDEAFNFSYPANLDCLANLGEITFFSPMNDTDLPPADLVWLPGGYPELFLNKLAANKNMMEQLKTHVEQGKALIAECGGMMYLGKSIIDKNGKEIPMTGLLDVQTSFEQMKLHLGYREVENSGGACWKGHEFHYSKYIDNELVDSEMCVKNARGGKVLTPIYRKKNCWASYLHLYLGEEEKMKTFLQELNLKIR